MRPDIRRAVEMLKKCIRTVETSCTEEEKDEVDEELSEFADELRVRERLRERLRTKEKEGG